jgi:hypothetical protein
VKYDDAVHLLDEARRAGVSVIGMGTGGRSYVYYVT